MSNSAVYDLIIIGAGLTGLNLAQSILKTSPSKKVMILEKSKSCGGRMATRRIDDLKFDHGAQFIKRARESESWIQVWTREEVVRDFPSNTIDAVCGKLGITQLAKVLARGLDIAYNCRASILKQRDGLWEISSDEGLEFKAKTIVMTSPLPQSLEILQRSNYSYDPKLADIKYSPAAVVLIEGETDFDSDLAYSEDLGPDLFSICAQHKKGNAEGPAWTVVMSAAWSQTNFDLPDEGIIESAVGVIQNRLPDMQMKRSHLKKWKYCRAENRWPKYFNSPQTGLFLAGDAFGGASLLGALRSSDAVVGELWASETFLA
jgi:renalase